MVGVFRAKQQTVQYCLVQYSTVQSQFSVRAEMELPAADAGSPSSKPMDVVAPPPSLSRLDSWDVFAEDFLLQDMGK